MHNSSMIFRIPPIDAVECMRPILSGVSVSLGHVTQLVETGVTTGCVGSNPIMPPEHRVIARRISPNYFSVVMKNGSVSEKRCEKKVGALQTRNPRPASIVNS